MSIDDALVEEKADAILRAAGSGLRYYSMPSIRKAILDATRDAMLALRTAEGKR